MNVSFERVSFDGQSVITYFWIGSQVVCIKQDTKGKFKSAKGYNA